MSDEDLKPEQLGNHPIDYVTSLAKGGLGAVPFVGSLLAEIAGTLIPRQRMDRLAKFSTQLHARVDNIEEKVRAKLSDETFTDLIEEVMRQAGRATSDARRSYLATLLAKGIDSTEISAIESKHLARILGELNDAEVIWLIFYATRFNVDDDALRDFVNTHATVLTKVNAHHHSDPADWDKQTMQMSYQAHLAQLGLLRPRYAINRKTNSPEFDRHGRQKVKGYESTSLGRLLVRQISEEATTVDDLDEATPID